MSIPAVEGQSDEALKEHATTRSKIKQRPIHGFNHGSGVLRGMRMEHGLTVYKRRFPVELGMPADRRGAASSTSGVNCVALIVIMKD